MGGHIRLESTPGHGTAVILTLPAEPSDEGVDEGAREPARVTKVRS
jgi:hypothetical protein